MTAPSDACYLARVKLVLSNLPPDHAESVAESLVVEHLAACVNLLPVRSIYRWQGELQKDEEVTLLIKVADERVGPLRERLRALHPYELPEIVVLEVDDANSLHDYVQWVEQECKPS